MQWPDGYSLIGSYHFSCPDQMSIPGISSVSDLSFSYSDMA